MIDESKNEQFDCDQRPALVDCSFQGILVKFVIKIEGGTF